MGVQPPDTPGAAAVAAGAPPWPARTQRLLEDIQRLCASWLHEPLRLCLGDFDRRLHEQSDRTRSHLDQQRYLATRQRLLQDRQAFEERFIASLARGFAQLGHAAPAMAPSLARQPLSLLDPLEHELTAALDQLVARNEARNGPMLVELSYRLAVLVGAPPLEAEALPLGPQAIARAFRDASAALGLPAEHHLLLLQSLEGTLIQGLGRLYESVNAQLTGDGILPSLRAFPLPRSTPRPPRASAISAASSPPSAPTSASASGGLGNLRELLARQRGGGATVAAGAHLASAGQVQRALLAVQQQLEQHPDPVGRPRSAPWLRDALQRQLDADQPVGAAPLQPEPEHDDILELIARLFEQLARQLPPGDPALPFLGALQLPLLRLAIADREFFARRDHPAQQLLAKWIDTAHEWLDGQACEGEQSLRRKLDQLLDQLHREPPDSALHARLLAELEQHLAQLQPKAQMAERRHVEAMQGRERLEQARLRAAALIAERFALTAPRGLLRALLERAWSDVLALTLLRHGEQSEAFASRLVITDQLLGRLPPGNLPQLQRELESGLQQIGIEGAEAEQVAQRLIGAGIRAADEDTPSATTLALRLKQRQRLGETDNPLPAAPLNAAATTPEERRLHDRLGQLRFGSWFEFTEPTSGRLHRRKLAWYSPTTGHSLFVTRHGQRSEEMTLPQLAGGIASGRVRECRPSHANLLDQAWRALALGLRQPRDEPEADR